jgi:hypothetical protein
MMLHLRLHHLLLFCSSLLPLLASSLILDNNVNKRISASFCLYQLCLPPPTMRAIFTSARKNKGLGAFAPLSSNGANVGTYEGEILTDLKLRARYWSTRVQGGR